MSLETLRALETTIRAEIPSFEVRFKDESRLMAVLGVLMRPFNPTFMRGFTTTLGDRVYFPTKAGYEGTPDSSVVTLAHEFVHMYDSREVGRWFQLSYALPQILALPFFLGYAVLGSPLVLGAFILSYVGLAFVAGKLEVKPGIVAWVSLGVHCLLAIIASIIITRWWALLLVAGLLCLAPWTSPGRTRWEVRGYSMNLAIYVWVRNALVPEAIIEEIVEEFTGPSYWFMCRDAAKVEAQFHACLLQTLERKLEAEKPYSVIHDFLVGQGRVAPAFKE